MSAWDYGSAIDVFAASGRCGLLVFVPEDSLEALKAGPAAVGRVAVEFGAGTANSEYVYLSGPTTWGVTKQLLARFPEDFGGPNIPADRAIAADMDLIVARLRAAGVA